MERNGSSEGSDSPPIGLGLELATGGSACRPMISCRKSSRGWGFTVLQLQELQLQSLIYRHMQAGSPVPRHLLLPIWKSVSASIDGPIETLYQVYPSLVGCSQLCLEYYKEGVEAEPGRCRRTDGKKWRCSKPALPDQKYCERHMHRGRQRSRKLVEADNSKMVATTNLYISLPLVGGNGGGGNPSPLRCGAPPNPRHVVYGGDPRED